MSARARRVGPAEAEDRNTSRSGIRPFSTESMPRASDSRAARVPSGSGRFADGWQHNTRACSGGRRIKFDTDRTAEIFEAVLALREIHTDYHDNCGSKRASNSSFFAGPQTYDRCCTMTRPRHFSGQLSG